MKQFTLFTAGCTGNNKNSVYPNKVMITDEAEFQKAVSYDHVCASYRDNRRSNENFIYSDCIMMDCDNTHSENSADWKDAAAVQAAFPNVAFAICYSRNHLKEKDGKAARPKFHVYFPIEQVKSADQYTNMKRQLHKMFPEFDGNALDAGRFFFGVEMPSVTFFEGSKTVDKLFITAGGRNTAMSKKAASIIKRYGNTDDARNRFYEEAKKCIPPLEAEELNSIWKSATKFGERIMAEADYIPPEQFGAPQERLQKLKPEENKLYPWTELGAGQLFADYHKDVLRYVPARKCWYYYEDGVWQPDTGNLKAMEKCKELAKHLGIYCMSISDDQRRDDYSKFCFKWHTRKMRETILRDAQSVHPIDMQEFDRDPYIFNCKNGTLHLKTMKFTEHKPEDKLSKKSNVEYNPEACCERFEQFVDEIMCGDKERAKFLQKVLGYGLSGDTRYECMFIFYGVKTRNGKGTLCESVLNVIGSYGCTSQAETIGIKANKSSRMPSEDVARLAGMRFVNISEPDRNLRIDAALVKTMTGNDTLNARFLNENSFDFKPQFKLYINTNYLPGISDLTLFNSDRMVIIPFERRFTEQEQDKNLKTLFAQPNSQSAILNWLVEGYRLLSKEGLGIPDSVKMSIEEYRKESDKVARFVEDCLSQEDGAETRTATVYRRYNEWCKDNGYNPEGAGKFNQALSSFATIERKRPKGGGNQTTVLIGYDIADWATAM